MPDPAGTKNNGGIKFVRQVVSIAASDDQATNYIVKKGSLKAGSKRVVEEDENGVENKQAFMKQIRSGSLTLQFTSEDSKPPKQFAEATIKATDGANITVIISEVDEDFGSDTPATVTVPIYEKQA